MRFSSSVRLGASIRAVLALVALSLPVSLAASQSYASGRVLVKFKDNTVRTMSDDQLGLKYTRSAVDSVGVYDIIDDSTVAEKVAKLSTLQSVALVEPDYRVTVKRSSNDPLYPQQWHLPVISADTAWNSITGTGAVKVCVIDSGARIDHPDLVANIAGGWNLVPIPQVTGAAPPSPGTAAYANYNDTLGHGTHTAGSVAAAGNNGLGVAGVAWRTKLYICRFIWDDEAGYISDAMTCMSLCRAAGAMITSNSWGGIDYSTFLYDEIAKARDAGQLFVNAAGNSAIDMNTNPRYPASYNLDNIISVAATSMSDGLSAYSNYGTDCVHIGAPGDYILSTTYNGLYGRMYGTSMATPSVAGAASLVQAAALSRGKTLTYSAIRAYLLANADTLASLKGYVASARRLNVAKAVAAVLADFPPSPPPKKSPPPSPKKSPPPPVKRPPPPKTSPPPPLSSAVPPVAAVHPITVPTCGTTLARGQPARQSSTWSGHPAARAVNGNCNTDVVDDNHACSMTKPGLSNAWWTVDLGSVVTVAGVVVKARSDCAQGCFTDLAGAQILLGSEPWTSAASLPAFTPCGVVPSKLVPGARAAVTCAAPTPARYVAVYLPKAATALALCEVDVVTA
ncbi:hypothetical protein ACKKBG_A26240 [Auxenochlorella protothecoides x Auxenochlorella symbiontica]